MEVCFIQTGGTIDKDYPRATKGYAFEIEDAAARRVLTRLPHSLKTEFITAFRKDSLDITEEDRESLLQHVLLCKCSRIVVTHGTDTLLDTARYLQRGALDKVIVLTGAHRPEMFSDSDAGFNLGCAVGALSLLEQSGVYVAMSGLVLPVDQVERDCHGCFKRRTACDEESEVHPASEGEVEVQSGNDSHANGPEVEARAAAPLGATEAATAAAAAAGTSQQTREARSDPETGSDIGSPPADTSPDSTHPRNPSSTGRPPLAAEHWRSGAGGSQPSGQPASVPPPHSAASPLQDRLQWQAANGFNSSVAHAGSVEGERARFSFEPQPSLPSYPVTPELGELYRDTLHGYGGAEHGPDSARRSQSRGDYSAQQLARRKEEYLHSVMRRGELRARHLSPGTGPGPRWGASGEAITALDDFCMETLSENLAERVVHRLLAQQQDQERSRRTSPSVAGTPADAFHVHRAEGLGVRGPAATPSPAAAAAPAAGRRTPRGPSSSASSSAAGSQRAPPQRGASLQQLQTPTPTPTPGTVDAPDPPTQLPLNGYQLRPSPGSTTIQELAAHKGAMPIPLFTFATTDVTPPHTRPTHSRAAPPAEQIPAHVHAAADARSSAHATARAPSPPQYAQHQHTPRTPQESQYQYTTGSMFAASTDIIAHYTTTSSTALRQHAYASSTLDTHPAILMHENLRAVQETLNITRDHVKQWAAEGARMRNLIES